jgi:hypothetical protein
MRTMYCIAVLMLALAARAAAGEAAGSTGGIAPLLPEKPAGFGRPITDRDAWKKLAANRSYQGALRRAEGLSKQPIPDSPDELYLDFSKTGNRSRWQRVASQRRSRIGYLTIAECLQDKGRFLPALRKAVAAVCAERTWVMPAHDRGLSNFKGTSIDIDLGAAHLAWDLATSHYLLGEKLDAETRKLIRENLRRRIFQPYLAMAAGKRKANWWTRTTNNWNAVCLAGVTGSALATIESRDERAKFVAAAQNYSLNFLKGFTADGYCSEGLGYWGYGFGHYVLLSEAISQATGGKVDLLAREQVRAPATFAMRIEIISGVYPAFADCSVGAQPSSRLVHFLGRRYGLGAEAARDRYMIHASSSLGPAMMYSFPNSATKAPPAGQAVSLGPRTFFQHGGVLICRPGEHQKCRMGVALKGGHNAEHHNHNDVGSYVVVVGKRPVLCDPGAEVYTARTFSSRRYDSNVLNSYGHPVPKVAGKLQRTGRKAQGRILRTDFTDTADTFVLDISSAYSVPELKTLRRTFVYSRRGAGALTVTDEVVLGSPKEFETALITLGKWRKDRDGSLTVSDSGEAVRVKIDTGGQPYELHAEKIKEDVRTRSLPTRVGIRLTGPVAKAAVTVTITPASPAGGGKAEGS